MDLEDLFKVLGMWGNVPYGKDTQDKIPRRLDYPDAIDANSYDLPKELTHGDT